MKNERNLDFNLMWLETAPTVWRLAISGQRSVVSGKPANPLNPAYQGDFKRKCVSPKWVRTVFTTFLLN